MTPLVCHERVVTTFLGGREAAGIAIDSAQISDKALSEPLCDWHECRKVPSDGA